MKDGQGPQGRWIPGRRCLGNTVVPVKNPLSSLIYSGMYWAIISSGRPKITHVYCLIPKKAGSITLKSACKMAGSIFNFSRFRNEFRENWRRAPSSPSGWVSWPRKRSGWPCPSSRRAWWLKLPWNFLGLWRTGNWSIHGDWAYCSSANWWNSWGVLPSGKLTVCYWKWPSRNSSFTQL